MLAESLVAEHRRKPSSEPTRARRSRQSRGNTARRTRTAEKSLLSANICHLRKRLHLRGRPFRLPHGQRRRLWHTLRRCPRPAKTCRRPFPGASGLHRAGLRRNRSRQRVRPLSGERFLPDGLGSRQRRQNAHGSNMYRRPHRHALKRRQPRSREGRPSRLSSATGHRLPGIHSTRWIENLRPPLVERNQKVRISSLGKAAR